MCSSQSTGKSRWRGGVRFGDGWAQWVGAVGDAVMHSHFAAQAVVAADPVDVLDSHGRCVKSHVVLIDPLVPHRLMSCAQAEVIFVEPTMLLPEHIRQRLIELQRYRAPAVLSQPDSLRSFWRDQLESRLDERPPEDVRITTALRAIEHMIGRGPVSLSTGARAVGLSSERFRHLFAEKMGLPFRRYVLWRRLRLAAIDLTAGGDVSSAAHAAGFADEAHFARTFKAAFGVTARTVLSRN